MSGLDKLQAPRKETTGSGDPVQETIAMHAYWTVQEWLNGKLFTLAVKENRTVRVWVYKRRIAENVPLTRLVNPVSHWSLSVIPQGVLEPFDIDAGSPAVIGGIYLCSLLSVIRWVCVPYLSIAFLAQANFIERNPSKHRFWGQVRLECSEVLRARLCMRVLSWTVFASASNMPAF